MHTRYPETMSFLKTIPPALDSSIELDQILDFAMESIEKKYGFEGVGLQLVDYEKKKIKFTKLQIPSISKESLTEIENTEIPLNSSGGVCFFVVNQNFTVYFEDIQAINPELYYMTEYDARFIKLLKHRTHLIIPVSFEGKVVVLVHFSSYNKTVSLTKEQREKLKDISFSIGLAFYKTYNFKNIYEDNQQLVVDLIKAREARDLFLAGINHELKTPLNAVMGFSEYLSKTKNLEEKKVHRMANTIYKNGKTLLWLIQEIIEIYKISSGKVQSDIKKIHAPQLLSDIAEVLAPLYEAKNQEVVFKSQNFYFSSDRQRINRVLTNLVGNAIKYTQEKGKIVVEATAKDGLVSFTIEDNGMGIEPEEQQDLFLPFRRGKKAYLKEEGSGLGLFVTNELVRVLEGEVFYKPKAKGSVFTVLLPKKSL